MKRLALLCFLAVLGTGAGALAAGGSPLAPLEAWVGKYGFDEIEGRDILGVKAFDQKVRKTLGEKRYELFKGEYFHGVTFPAEKKGDVLLFHFCKPHDCADYMIYLYANLAENSVEACWMRRSEVDAFWLTETKEPQNIGVAGCLDDLPFGLYQVHHKGRK